MLCCDDHIPFPLLKQITLSIHLNMRAYYQSYKYSSQSKTSPQNDYVSWRDGRGSGVDPASSYRKVVGSIPLVSMSKCP